MTKIIMWLLRRVVSISPIHFIIACVSILGWDIAFKTDEDNIKGLVIGTEKFIDEHTPKE